MANELHDYVDFDSLFSNVLLSDLGVSAPEYTPIRRRALVAVGEWASVRFDHKGKKDLRSQVRSLRSDLTLTRLTLRDT